MQFGSKELRLFTGASFRQQTKPGNQIVGEASNSQNTTKYSILPNIKMSKPSTSIFGLLKDSWNQSAIICQRKYLSYQLHSVLPKLFSVKVFLLYLVMSSKYLLDTPLVLLQHFSESHLQRKQHRKEHCNMSSYLPWKLNHMTHFLNIPQIHSPPPASSSLALPRLVFRPIRLKSLISLW